MKLSFLRLQKAKLKYSNTNYFEQCEKYALIVLKANYYYVVLLFVKFVKSYSVNENTPLYQDAISSSLSSSMCFPQIICEFHQIDFSHQRATQPSPTSVGAAQPPPLPQQC